MTLLSYDRYCDEIIRQTSLLASIVKDADLTVRCRPVPAGPRAVLRHVGDLQRWAGRRSRPADGLPVEHSHDLPPGAATIPRCSAHGWPRARPRWAGHWRRPGPARRCGPRCPAGPRTSTHAVSRTRRPSTGPTRPWPSARDTISTGPWRWTPSTNGWSSARPRPAQLPPRIRELLGPGRTLHFHATDTPPEAGAEWLVDLTGQAIAWRRAHGRAAVAVRGPLTDLLLVIYKRRPARGGGIEIFGDAALLDFWLERVSFG